MKEIFISRQEFNQKSKLYIHTNRMIIWYLKRYRRMILPSIFFFYLGCCVTLSLVKIECVQHTRENDKKLSSIFHTVEYAVLILSSPSNEAKRDAIRTTWANFIDNIFIENGERLYKWNHTRSGKTVKHDLIKFFFVLGTKSLDSQMLERITSENSRSNDLLLLENFEDNYVNLSKKLILSLKWLNDNLKHLKYTIKCDDDSFVRVDIIIRDLEAFGLEMSEPSLNPFVSYKKSLPSYKGLYWGYFDGRAKVYLKGKWQEKEWFLCDHYLPYALGGGYVISQSIVDFVARNSDFLSHYNSEDVSMGVWTAALDGINRVHDIRFDTEWKSRGCDTNMIVRHKQTPSDMFQMYRMLVNSQGTKLCKTESLLRKSYHYNWNILPSMCCK